MNSLSAEDQQRLIQEALEARRFAHAPYSHFAVGAAVLAEDGRVFRGVNVENSSYGLTICAERVAVAAAIASGATGFAALAVATDGGHTPCGACRQFLAEWGVDVTVLCVDVAGAAPPKQYLLRDLLPDAFHLGDG